MLDRSEDSAKCPFGKSGRGQTLAPGMSEAVEHEADHGDGGHRLGHLGQLLVVLGEAAPSAEPAERPLDHPAARENDEAGGARDPPHDDQRQAEQETGEQGSQTIVDAVGEHDLKPAVQRLDLPQQLPGPVGVLDVGRVDDDPEQQPRAVDRDVALAAPDLLGRIVAPRPPFSVVLTLWVSMMAAVGLGSRPDRSRSAATS
jgi:hypothetical protein